MRSPLITAQTDLQACRCRRIWRRQFSMKAGLICQCRHADVCTFFQKLCDTHLLQLNKKRKIIVFIKYNKYSAIVRHIITAADTQKSNCVYIYICIYMHSFISVVVAQMCCEAMRSTGYAIARCSPIQPKRENSIAPVSSRNRTAWLLKNSLLIMACLHTPPRWLIAIEQQTPVAINHWPYLQKRVPIKVMSTNAPTMYMTAAPTKSIFSGEFLNAKRMFSKMNGQNERKKLVFAVFYGHTVWYRLTQI